MAVTGTSALSPLVQTQYNAKFILDFLNFSDMWPLVWWQEEVGKNLKGTTIIKPLFKPLTPSTASIAETSDITPEVLPTVGTVSVTIAEYGRAVQETWLGHIAAYADIVEPTITTLAQSKARDLDLLVRAQMLAGSAVSYAGTATTRAGTTGLDTSADLPTYDFIMNLVGRARNAGVPPFDDNTFVAVVNSYTLNQVRKITEITAVNEYSDPGAIYTGESSIVGKRFKNERFMVAGLRFVESVLGKVYLSGGTVAQAATAITTGQPIAVNGTTLYVDELTGLVAGNYVTIGTLESDAAEQVYISAASAASGAGTLTIVGAGSSGGCMYAHSAGVAVTEAANVGAIPVLGPRSIVGYWADQRDGRQGVTVPNTVIPDRFSNYYWYWCGGLSKIDRYVVRGECAISGNIIGDNKNF